MGVRFFGCLPVFPLYSASFCETLRSQDSLVCVCTQAWFETHSAGGVDAWPLHGDSDAVEEDDDQHDMVKHLVGDDPIAHDPKPDKRNTKFSDTRNGLDM